MSHVHAFEFNRNMILVIQHYSDVASSANRICHIQNAIQAFYDHNIRKLVMVSNARFQSALSITNSAKTELKHALLKLHMHVL